MQMANLLLVMSHADTAVKSRLCEPETLRTLFTAIENSPEALQLTVLKAIKQLTSDPSMLEALEVCCFPCKHARYHVLNTIISSTGAIKASSLSSPSSGQAQVSASFGAPDFRPQQFHTDCFQHVAYMSLESPMTSCLAA